MKISAPLLSFALFSLCFSGPSRADERSHLAPATNSDRTPGNMGAATGSDQNRVSVIAVTDCGSDVDDQWAIMHIALSPQIKLVGVIGDFAPNAHDTVNCSKGVVAAAGLTGIIPVLEGATGPLPIIGQTAGQEIGQGLSEGAAFILRAATSHSSSNRLRIAILGPGTTVAAALRADPSLSDRISIAALAFDSYPAGGDGWNVANDVAAWQIIFDSETPIVAASGVLAGQDLNLRRDEPREMLGDCGTRGLFLTDLFERWLQENGALFPETDNGTHWPAWDEAVTATLLNLAETEVVPRPRLKDDLTFAFPNVNSGGSFAWAKRIDRPALFADLRRAICPSDAQKSERVY